MGTASVHEGVRRMRFDEILALGETRTWLCQPTQWQTAIPEKANYKWVTLRIVPLAFRKRLPDYP
jgi:hypothetical protein